jgi:uncharacterized protein (DUF305 family)
MRLVRARGPRRAEGCSRASARRAPFARHLALRLALRRHAGVWHLLRRTRFGLVVAMCALALVYATACSSSSSGDTPFMAKSEAAMDRMMATMQITPTNNVDRDFVAMMAPHHQGAIDMAEAELSYGHNRRLRSLAQEIIVTQQEEIMEMRVALDDAAASPSIGPEEAAFLAESEAAMNRMMAAMQIKPSGDTDRDFVAMMMPHHQGAIDMAEAELRYGRNEPLRGLAEEIIATQEQQIAVMRRAVGELLVPSLSSSRPISQVRVAYSLIL